MDQPRHAAPDLHSLIELFYSSPEELGTFAEVEAVSMPEVYRRLLVHDQHMTVAVEDYHAGAVDLRVLETHVTETHYSRKVLLTRQLDGRVVQFGIVRLNLDYLGPDVREEIENQKAPLGRILIQHNILRTVKLLSLWRIAPGSDLRKLFGLQTSTTCYGRTALIYCNGVIAVELLEVVTPAEWCDRLSTS